MAEEMRSHLEMAASAQQRDGTGETEAQFAAQREFGGIDQAKERCGRNGAFRGWSKRDGTRGSPCAR